MTATGVGTPLENPQAGSREQALGPADARAFVASHQETGATELFGITELCKEVSITLHALRCY